MYDLTISENLESARWVCQNCGNTEYIEREVICWKCGKGEMIYHEAEDSGIAQLQQQNGYASDGSIARDYLEAGRDPNLRRPTPAEIQRALGCTQQPQTVPVE